MEHAIALLVQTLVQTLVPAAFGGPHVFQLTMGSIFNQLLQLIYNCAPLCVNIVRSLLAGPSIL